MISLKKRRYTEFIEMSASQKIKALIKVILAVFSEEQEQSDAEATPLGAGMKASKFVSGAVDDALTRGTDAFGVTGHRLPADEAFVEATLNWARENDASTVVTGFVPVGWVRPRLKTLQTALIEDGRELRQLQRPWDTAFWPHAKKGFFGLKKQIQSVYGELGLPV